MCAATVRRCLLVVTSAILILATSHFLYHEVRVTESFMRAPLH